jgi:hypothetical protein
MKKRILGGLLAAMLILGVLAPAAMADVNGIAFFQGTARVGADFASTCNKTGGVPTGKGLGTLSITENKNNAWSLAAPFTFVGTTQDGPGVYEGRFNACGYLTAPLNAPAPVGASCASTKGHHGIGQATAESTEPLGQKLNIKLFDINWKAAIGGTLLISGSYQERGDNNVKKAKYGILYAVVQVAPDQSNLLGCLDKTQTAFTTIGTADLVNTGATHVDKGKPNSGLPFGTKECGKSGGTCPAPGPRK